MTRRSSQFVIAYGSNPAHVADDHIRRIAAANGLGITPQHASNINAFFEYANEPVNWENGMSDKELLARHVSTMLMMVRDGDVDKVFTPARNAAHYGRLVLGYERKDFYVNAKAKTRTTD